MPKRIEQYRLLHEPLRQRLGRPDEFGDDGWPKYDQLFAYLRQQLDWAGSEREYRLLRLHGTGPASMVEGLLAYLIMINSDRLADLCAECETGASPTALLEEMLERHTSIADYEHVSTDYREADGWMRLPSMFAATGLADESRMLVRDSERLRELSAWILRDVGAAVSREDANGSRRRRQRRLTAEEYRRIGEERMGRSTDEYFEQLRTWWQVSEWAVAEAVLGDSAIGASAIVPLSEQAYIGIRDGEMSDLEITRDHLRRRSRHLLVESLTTTWERLPKTRVGWVTGRQLACIVYQAARLTWDDGETFPPGTPIHILVIGGTQEAARRLERHGYANVGSLRDFGVPLYELVLPDPAGASWLPRTPRQAYSMVFAACYSHFRHEG